MIPIARCHSNRIGGDKCEWAKTVGIICNAHLQCAEPSEIVKNEQKKQNSEERKVVRLLRIGREKCRLENAPNNSLAVIYVLCKKEKESKSNANENKSA